MNELSDGNRINWSIKESIIRSEELVELRRRYHEVGIGAGCCFAAGVENLRGGSGGVLPADLHLYRVSPLPIKAQSCSARWPFAPPVLTAPLPVPLKRQSLIQQTKPNHPIPFLIYDSTLPSRHHPTRQGYLRVPAAVMQVKL